MSVPGFSTNDLLRDAICNFSLDELSTLLSSGANANAFDEIVGNVLSTAIVVRNEPAAKLLLKHGADPNRENAVIAQHPLELACSVGSRELVQALISAGADVNRVGSFGVTAEELAVEMLNFEVVTTIRFAKLGGVASAVGEWLARASEGCPEAWENLCVFYGMVGQHTKAFEAAKTGAKEELAMARCESSHCMLLLATKYANGLGTEKNLRAASMLFRQATLLGQVDDSKRGILEVRGLLPPSPQQLRIAGACGAARKTCGYCGASRAMYLCKKCKEVYYCNRACQRAHWYDGAGGEFSHQVECFRTAHRNNKTHA